MVAIAALLLCSTSLRQRYEEGVSVAKNYLGYKNLNGAREFALRCRGRPPCPTQEEEVARGNVKMFVLPPNAHVGFKNNCLELSCKWEVCSFG